jgi:hypothetical protein
MNTIDSFIKQNNNTDIVAVYEFNINNKLYYKTFKFNSVDKFIKNCILIIDTNIVLPKLYLSNKIKRYDNEEIDSIIKFIKNIYYLRNKIKQLTYL